MPINWNEVKRAMYPIKDYEDLSQRWQESFSYPFVRAHFNFTLPELAGYTGRLLGGDSRGRYSEYLSRLVSILGELEHAGVDTVLDLTAQVETRDQLAAFVEQSGVDATDVVTVLKYLIYWVIPAEKRMSGLVRGDPAASDAIKALGDMGVRTNLQLLQHGITTSGRKSLAKASGLPESVIMELVNRADLSRLPWSSKATISNIMGAGYGSLAKLANADPETLYEDFFRYGKKIRKNLKLGNEIENSHRIAKIVPAVLEEK